VDGIAGGLASAVLGYGLLPFFEHIFGVTTDIRLLELGNPGHPLLRRLMVEAPGTYSHSVMTANLAESAAEDIGANPLLARVGAYYHDVGKIRRPGFFVENQSEGINPHDNTAPSLSALIITAHVKEGLELAREHKLPEELTQIIEQHHGNSLVSYFYNKAKEADDGANEADFRYPGSRPQSREAALVMLADSCEAAVRALKKPLHPKVEATVRKIVDGKVGDGQLNDPCAAQGDEPIALGDVIIAPEVAARQAVEYGNTIEGELNLLLVHGVLHLLGYDHEDDDDAAAMQERERALLAAYADRA
jgi:rRNA maturation RNase YbeY